MWCVPILYTPGEFIITKFIRFNVTKIKYYVISSDANIKKDLLSLSLNLLSTGYEHRVGVKTVSFANPDPSF